jgi:ABC-type phosphate transport system substrate-binding protein
MGVVAAAVSLLAAAPARADTMCSELPNVIVVTGSIDFEPVLKELAVRMAAETPPATVVTVSSAAQATSCAAVAGLAAGTEFGGLPGRYYTRSGSEITTKSCTLSAGQTPHVAISDAFYESCTGAPQPRPADIADVLGPVQPIVFAVPQANTIIQTLTQEEARLIYGCGVSSALSVADYFSNPGGVFCLEPASGSQLLVARNLGLVESGLIAPKCVRKANDARLLFDLIPLPTPCEAATSMCQPPMAAVGFSNMAAFEVNRTRVKQLAFRAAGQTMAFYADSGPLVSDRRNVRDGHYPVWGYVHFITRTTGGNLSPQASELIGWINGAKTSAAIDHVSIEAAAGLIPLCAMKVKRSSDGGLLSPYSPQTPCHCGFEARATQASPVACTPCVSATACPSGLTCRHGFCD